MVFKVKCHSTLQLGVRGVGQASRATIIADSAGLDYNAYILLLILFASYFLVEVEFYEFELALQVELFTS